MSKSEGKKIAVKFSEKLIGDITGLSPVPVNGYEDVIEKNGVATAYNYYSSAYLPEKAFDNNESSMWYTRAPIENWIQIEFEVPRQIYKFRWKPYSSYAPKDFEVLGSNDGMSFESLYVGTSDKVSVWTNFFEFTGLGEYKFYRWRIISAHGSYLYIYEIEPVYKKPIGNEFAFSVTGMEPLYINYPDETLGPLIERSLNVKSIEQHPTEKNAVVITMKDVEEFKNIEGTITLNYNASFSNLSGLGGPVSSFNKSFLPTDLIRKPNPKLTEHITTSIKDYDLDLVPIYHKEAYSDPETISTSITNYQINLISIDEIDP